MTLENFDTSNEQIKTQIIKTKLFLVDGKFFQLEKLSVPKQTVPGNGPARWVKETVIIKPIEEDTKTA